MADWYRITGGSWSLSGTTSKTATYTVEIDDVDKVVAKITGLANTVEQTDLDALDVQQPVAVDEDENIGKIASAGLITLPGKLLGTSKVALTLSNGAKYKLALDDSDEDLTEAQKKATLTITDTNVSGTKVTYKGNVGVGWIQTNDKTLTYNKAAKAGVTLATVSGITKVTDENKVAVTEAVVNSNNVITLKDAALSNSKITLSTSYGYDLAIDGATNGVKGLEKDQNNSWSISGTTATYKFGTSEGYTLAEDKKSIAYTKATTTTIATLKGLAKGLTIGTDQSADDGEGEDDGEGNDNTGKIVIKAADGTETPVVEVEDPTDEGSFDGSIKLSKGALGTTTVSLALATAYKNQYGLGIDNTVPEETDAYAKNVWVVSGTTATYKTVTPEYYTLNNNTIVYKKETSGAILAKISGIKSGLVFKEDGLYLPDADENDEPVVEVTGDPDDNGKFKIKIYEDALNGTVTLSNTTDYVLELDTEVDGAGSTEPEWSLSGTTSKTATYKGTVTAGYDLDSTGKKITYTKAGNSPTTILTITGLDKNLVLSTIGDVDELGESVDEGKIGVYVTDETDPENPRTYFNELITFGEDDDAKTITVKAAALGTSSVAVSNKAYTLAFDTNESDPDGYVFKDDLADYGNNFDEDGNVYAWRTQGSNAYYRKISRAYYSIDENTGKILYTPEKTVETLLTLTGFNKNLEVKNDGLYNGEDKVIEFGDFDTKAQAAVEAVEDDPNTDENETVVGKEAVEAVAGTIKVLSRDALTTSNLKITSGNYTFDISELEAVVGEEDEKETLTGAEALAPAQVKDGQLWTVGVGTSGSSKATYKSQMSAGYTFDAETNAKQIKYVPASSNTVLAQIDGLAKGLVVSKASDKVWVRGEEDENGEPVFNLENATAGKLGYYDTSEGTKVFVEVATVENNVISLDEKALSTTASITTALTTGKDDYTLFTDLDLTTPPNDVRVWVADKTPGEYSYKTYTPDYYTYGVDDEDQEDNTKIVYHAKDYSEPIVTVKGIRKDLIIITDPDENAYYGQIGHYNDDNLFDEDVEMTSNVIIHEGALDKKDITLVNGKEDGNAANYSIELAGNEEIPEFTDERRLFSTQVTSGGKTTTTLTIKKGNTEGYKVDEEDSTKILYKEDSDGSIVTTITGLKDGLTVCDDDEMMLIGNDGESESDEPAKGKVGYVKTIKVEEYDEEAEEYITVPKEVFVEVLIVDDLGTGDLKVIILSRYALTEGGVTITDAKDDDGIEYALAFKNQEDFEPVAPTDDKKGWVVDGNNAYLVDYTQAGYTIDDDGNIAYVDPDFRDKETAVVTITGLKSGLKADVNGDIEGITVDDDGTITLSEDVLGDNDIKFTVPEENSNDYSLNTDDFTAPKKTNAWSAVNGTATYTETVSKGWTLEEASNDEGDGEESNGDEESEAVATVTTKMLFQPKTDIKTTITGLNTTLQPTALTDEELDEQDPDDADTNKIAGITVEVDEEGKRNFKISDISVFNNKSVELKNAADKEYTLELDEDIAAEKEDPYWVKTATSADATYKQATAAGYTQNANGTKIDYLSSKATVDLFVIKGLAKSVVPEEDDNTLIIGLEVTTNDAGENVVRVSKEVLGQSNVSIDKKYGYALELDGDAEDFAVKEDEAHWSYDKNKGTATLLKGETEGWAFKQTAGAGDDDPDNDEFDYQTLIYTPAKPETLATLSGLPKDLEVDEDGSIEGITFTEATPKETEEVVATETDPESEEQITKTETRVVTEAVPGVITLSARALTGGASKITLIGDDYELDLDGDVTTPEDGEKLWSFDGKGNGQYQYDTESGWELVTTKTVALKAKKTTVLAKLSGLDTDLNTWTGKDEKNKAIDEPVETPSGIEIIEHSVDEDGKIEKNSGIITITDESVLNKKNVTITSEGYTLEIDDALRTQDFEEPKWYLNGTTATLKSGKTAGYDPTSEENNKTIKYSTESANDTRVTITGLKSGVKIITDTEDENYGKLGIYDGEGEFHEITFEDYGEGGTIKLDKEVMGKSNVVLTNGKNTYDYRFDEFSDVTVPESEEPVWSGSKGTLKLNQHTSEGFELNEDGNKFTYSADKNPVVATISGLNTNLKASTATDKDADGELVGVGKIGSIDSTGAFVPADDIITYEADVITLKKEALGTSKVSLSLSNGGDYKLALDTDVPEDAEDATEWVTSKTTANFKNYEKAYYLISEDQKSITYKAATAGTTYLTITGLRENADLNDESVIFDYDDEDNKVIQLGTDQLSTLTVKLTKGTGYTLDFNNEFEINDEVGADSAEGKITQLVRDDNWTVSGTNATLKGTLTKGYTLATDGKSITYQAADKANQKIATISGLKSNASVSDTDGVIELGENQLGTSTVKLTGDGYKLALAEGKKPVVTLAESNWSVKSGAAYLKGAITTAGHMLSLDEKSAVYSKTIAAGSNLATIKGVNTVLSAADAFSADNTTIDADNKKIILSGEQLNNKVTLSGGLFAFGFGESYDDASIVGSASSDSISVEGSNVSINAGNGDDYVDLGYHNGNVFIYASGNGNDVIANFSSDDTINVTNVALTDSNIKTSGSDVIVTVGSGSIKILSAAGDTINIKDKSGKVQEFETEIDPGNVLADDNYELTPQLSELVNNKSLSYTADDINLTQDATALTKQSAIVYSSKK